MQRKRQLIYTRILLANLLLMAVFQSWLCVGQQYTAEGELLYELHLPSGTKDLLPPTQPGATPVPSTNSLPEIRRAVSKFKVIVDGEKWEVETVRVDSKTTSVRSDSFDGTNLLSFSNFKKVDSKSSNTAVGNLDNRNLPKIWSASAGAVAWLALASFKSLDEATNGTFVSISRDPSADQIGYGVMVPAVVERSSALPYLPKIVMCRQEGKPIFLFPSPFENGFLKSHYEALRWTNTGAYTYPVEFRFKTFNPDLKNGRTSNDLRTTLVVTGWITNFVLQSEALRSSYTGATLITDHRFTNENGVRLLVVDGNVPSTNDSLVTQARGVAATKRTLARVAATTQFTIYIVLGGAIALSFWFIVRQRD